jgi:hypothetical protein
MRENDFECLASPGVKMPGTMFPTAQFAGVVEAYDQQQSKCQNYLDSFLSLRVNEEPTSCPGQVGLSMDPIPVSVKTAHGDEDT